MGLLSTTFDETHFANSLALRISKSAAFVADVLIAMKAAIAFELRG